MTSRDNEVTHLVTKGCVPGWKNGPFDVACRVQPAHRMVRWLSGWFLLQAIALACFAGLQLHHDRSSPLWPAVVMGAVIAWVAFRLLRERRALRGALVGQLLTLVWSPFMVVIFPPGPCTTGLYAMMDRLETLAWTNLMALALAVAARATARRTPAGQPHR